MFSTSNAVYNLRNNARALASIKPVGNEEEVLNKHWFLVGSQVDLSDRQGENDILHLLEYDEEVNIVTELNIYTSKKAKLEQNCWLNSHPTDSSLVLAVNDSITALGDDVQIESRAVLYRLTYEDIGVDDDYIKELCTLPTDELCKYLGEVKQALWKPFDNEEGSHYDPSVLLTHSHGISLADVVIEKEIGKFDVSRNLENQTENEVLCAGWDPHHLTQVVIGNGPSMQCYDLNSMKRTISLDDSHGGDRIRSLDFNPNKPFFLASAGDDRKVKFWDLRNASKPVKMLTGHTHWVWCVRYNQLHDQLILSSSSDSVVALWRISSISSAPLLDLLSEEGDASKGESKETDDAIIRAYDNHEDSVYACAWSVTDAWIFASLSYDGKFVIHHVPSTEKYKILL